MNKKKITLVFVIATAMILGLLGYTYAYFSATVKEEGKTQTVIKANELSLTFNGTSEINTDDMIPGDSFTKTFTVENTSTVKTTYNIYMEQITNEFNEDLVYVLSDETGNLVAETALPTTNVGKTYILEDIEIEAGVTKEYTLTIEYKYLDTPQNDYQGAEFKATVGIDTVKVESVKTTNENVLVAYTYNQTSGAENYCVTGDEETCVETTCYESNNANSCASGTIIDYKVNDNDTVRFHVMYDNGDTLTMQAQRNTLYNVVWNGTEQDNSNTNGPMAILSVLENKTSNWTNVNEQTYTMGTTTFKTNAYTGCSAYNSCTTNTYTLPERSAKVRMITVQEANDLGCTDQNASCPIWMYNYLLNSTSYGGTANDATTVDDASSNLCYWTMNADISRADLAWMVAYLGNTSNRAATYGTNAGARAVVEINKL